MKIITGDCKQSAPIDNAQVAWEKPAFNGGIFSNPVTFTSYVDPPTLGNFKALLWILYRWFRGNGVAKIPPKEVLDQTLPVQYPTFDLQAPLSVTWLGHATLFVHMDSLSFITDPVWSSYAAPGGRFFCPRYRPTPCTIDQLPTINFSFISHNHYDHLDMQAVRLLSKRFPEMQWFVPKGLKFWMEAHMPKGSLVHEMVWGEHRVLSLGGVDFQVWCTPAQHWSQRSILDRNRSLWSSWAVVGPKRKFYFTGDSGFCSSIFQNIGKQLGPFDLAAIPIGSYAPRWLMKPQHMDPFEAVQVHQLIGAAKSVAIHWGTYAMGSLEDYLEPKVKLQEAIKALSAQDFFTLHHGATWSSN